MKCVKCGKRLRSSEKFCTNCGYYNDGKENDTWKEPTQDEDLLDENWYEDEVEANTKEDDEEIIPVENKKKTTKTKPKKETKKKEEKPKVEEKPKKQKETKIEDIIKEDKSKEFYSYENEKYLEAYIGEDYKIIKKSAFNIWAFLLNWMYFLYRKLFITGIIGLVITTLVAFLFTKYFLIYLIIMLIVLGFGFNPYYIFISKNKVEKTLKDYEGSDSFTLEKICREMGGVNIVFSLIIYAIFLIVIIVAVTGFRGFTTANTKFLKENSENQANCISLARLSYNQEKTNYNKISEALCKVSKGKNKKYTIYLKASKNNKDIYIYYETEEDYIVYKNNTSVIKSLEEKEKKNDITIEEMKLLSDLRIIENDYKNSRKKSLKEDTLIRNKKDKEEKYNYIVSYEELIR